MKYLKPFLLIVFFPINILTSNAQIIAIKAGHLIDPYSEKVLENKIILISGQTILDVVDNLNNTKPDETIDLSNAWVCPGLMDCHVHMTANMSYRNANLDQMYVYESDAYRVLRGAHNAELLLRGGFTTVKEIGNDGNYATADLIKAIANHWTQGPNILYAGKIIAPYGGQTNGIAPRNEFFWQYEYLDGDSHDEIRKAIRKNIYYGANSIKLVTGDQKYFYSEEDIRFAVEEAKSAGLKVSAHALGGEAAKNAILGGVASIEHGFFLNEELLKLMKEKGTFLVGTDFSFDNWYAYGMDSLTAAQNHEAIKNRLKLAYEIGVKMAFGTDIVVDINGENRLQSNLEVLSTWKEAGIPPMYLLKCMTSNAAELLGIENSRGRISKNFTADIVAFSDNPLDDIENIKKISFVMKEGTIIRSK